MSYLFIAKRGDYDERQRCLTSSGQEQVQGLVGVMRKILGSGNHVNYLYTAPSPTAEETAEKIGKAFGVPAQSKVHLWEEDAADLQDTLALINNFQESDISMTLVMDSLPCQKLIKSLKNKGRMTAAPRLKPGQAVYFQHNSTQYQIVP
ncbi:MAG: hypothetical protein KAT77_03815 [Nanoarchaeota archaeon]|nr:hypothetical protein [Nanoarchaeota archaeon]